MDDTQAITWPEILTPELADILGRPCFMFIKLAQIYRAAGHVIEKQAEAEQAFFLHRFLGHWFKHGEDGWRDAAWNTRLAMHEASPAETVEQGEVDGGWETVARDAVAALRYIEATNGRLYGVGWDRVYGAYDALTARPLTVAEPVEASVREKVASGIDRANGGAGDAIDYALGHIADERVWSFLTDWHDDDVSAWPNYHKWLETQRAGRDAAVAALQPASVVSDLKKSLILPNHKQTTA